MKRCATCALLLIACGAPQTAAVTIAPATASATASAPPPLPAACPPDYSRAVTATCTSGETCRYPQITCVCHMVPYCPGGAMREGPPPPAESLEFECMHPDCVDAADGAACSHAGVQCRGPACYSTLTCTAGHWKLLQLGPPP